MKFIFVLLILTLFSGCEVSPTANNSGNTNSANITSPSPTASPSPDDSTPRPDNSSPLPTPTLSPLPPDAKAVQAAIDVVQEYYNAINERDYRRAYELWEGRGKASDQTFDEFRDGFANTASVDIDTSGEPGNFQGAAGSQYVEIPLLINAKTKDGKTQKFWGQYVLRRSMVDGATPEQRLWRLYSAEFKEL